MTDLEKVIKGLECCTSLRSVGETCKKCPYDIPQTTACYRGQLLADALTLLKKQGAELLQQEAELDILRNIYRQENPTKQAVKWE